MDCWYDSTRGVSTTEVPTRTDLNVGAEAGAGPPDELQPLLARAQIAVLVVDAREPQGLEAHLSGQQARVGGRVAEGIDLPARGGHRPERRLQKAVAKRGLVDHVHVMGRSLVVPAHVTTAGQASGTCELGSMARPVHVWRWRRQHEHHVHLENPSPSCALNTHRTTVGRTCTTRRSRTPAAPTRAALSFAAARQRSPRSTNGCRKPVQAVVASHHTVKRHTTTATSLDPPPFPSPISTPRQAYTCLLKM